MQSGLTTRFQRLAATIGLLVAILALAAQVAIGAAMPPDETAQAQARVIAAAELLCQPGAPPHHPAPLHRHLPDDATCPLSVAYAHQGCTLVPSVLPTPDTQTRITLFGSLPPSRAPPSHTFAAAYPRGPPILA